MELAGVEAAQLPVNRSTWQRWHSRQAEQLRAAGTPPLIRPTTLKAIADKCGASVDKLLHTPELSFRAMCAAAKAIDERVLDLTRSLAAVSADRVREAYWDHLAAKLGGFGLRARALLQLLNDPQIIETIISSVPEPGLIIDIEPPFEAIELKTPSGEAIRLEKPQLLWDCIGAKGGRECNRQTCPIHSQRHAAVITRAFRDSLVRINWDGTTILWQRQLSLWPPSRDSFELASRIRRSAEEDLAECRTLLDLGSGTGFLGIALAGHCPKLRSLDLADWLLLPAFIGAVNLALNRQRVQKARCRVLLGMHTSWLEQAGRARRYDVVVCNPPYLPVLAGFEAIGTHAVVGATDLLEHVIEAAPAIGARVFVQYSSLARQEVARARRRSGVRVRPLGSSIRVPFRVIPAFEVNGYVSALRRKRRLIVTRGLGHRYWHTLTTARIEATTSGR